VTFDDNAVIAVKNKTESNVKRGVIVVSGVAVGGFPRLPTASAKPWNVSSGTGKL